MFAAGILRTPKPPTQPPAATVATAWARSHEEKERKREELGRRKSLYLAESTDPPSQSPPRQQLNEWGLGHVRLHGETAE